jgi:hypothetical protein
MSMKASAFASLPLLLVVACSGKAQITGRAGHPSSTPTARPAQAVSTSARDGRCVVFEGPAQVVTLLPSSAVAQAVEVYEGGSLQLSVHLSSGAALRSVRVSDAKIFGFLNMPQPGDHVAFLTMGHPGSAVVTAEDPGGAKFSRRFVVHC